MSFLKRSVVASLGSLIVGLGVVLNQRAGLGNDPVGIFYDGIRVLLHLNNQQLGIGTYVVNLVLIVGLLFLGRRYLHVGTILYFLFYGLAVQYGGMVYDLVIKEPALWMQIGISIIGCLCICVGVSLFIAVDIGYDPMTGTAWVIADALHWPFGRAKILFDGVLLVAGALMGGKLGVITVVTALVAGPIIQRLAPVFKRMIKN